MVKLVHTPNLSISKVPYNRRNPPLFISISKSLRAGLSDRFLQNVTLLVKITFILKTLMIKPHPTFFDNNELFFH